MGREIELIGEAALCSKRLPRPAGYRTYGRAGISATLIIGICSSSNQQYRRDMIAMDSQS